MFVYDFEALVYIAVFY